MVGGVSGGGRVCGGEGGTDGGSGRALAASKQRGDLGQFFAAEEVVGDAPAEGVARLRGEPAA